VRYTHHPALEKDWSTLTLGCWQIAPSGGWGDICSEQAAEAVVKTALDSGVTAFDTAEGYGDGESERRLSKALGSKLNDVIIISKIWPDADLSHNAFERRIDQSLKALRRDFIDVYLVHFPADYCSTKAKSQKLCELMLELRSSGKARTIGLSNFHKKELLALGPNLAEFVVNEVPYSLLEREYEGETALLCQKAQMPFLAYSPTAKGLLARPITKEDLNYPARKRNHLFNGQVFKEAQKVYEVVAAIAKEHGCRPINIALEWVLRQKNILTTIVGSRKPEQIQELQSTGDIELSEAQLKQLTKASDAFYEAAYQTPRALRT